jgi:hypothetical protein
VYVCVYVCVCVCVWIYLHARTHTGEYDAKEAILAQMTEDVQPEAQIMKRKPNSDFI